MLAVILHLLSSPRAAAWAVSFMFGDPSMAPALVAICERESGCRAIGVHEVDAVRSRLGWNGQVALGHLDPRCQPYVDGQWATHGAWGMSAASSWPYLPRCYQPWILDWVFPAAIAAALRYQDKCKRRPDGWCPRRFRRAKPVR